MPTIRWAGPHRFFYFASDRGEPPHVHVARDDSAAKVWLSPVRLADSAGFSAWELTRVLRIVSSERDGFLEHWHELFHP